MKRRSSLAPLRKLDDRFPLHTAIRLRKSELRFVLRSIQAPGRTRPGHILKIAGLRQSAAP